MGTTYIGLEAQFTTETSYEQDKFGLVNYTVKSIFPLSVTVTTPSLGDTIGLNGRTLRAVAVNATKTNNGFSEFVVTYQGDGGTSTLQQDGSNSTGEEPIASNRNFNVSQDASPSIVQLSGGRATLGLDGVVVGTGGALFDSDGGFLYFRKDAKYNLFGVTSYLNPNLVYRRSFTTSTKPSLSAVGRIVSPTADFPAVLSGATWLCLGITYQKRGSVYDVTHEFRASGRNGWNTYIYGGGVAAPPIS